MSRSNTHKANILLLIFLGGLIVYLSGFVTLKNKLPAVNVTQQPDSVPARLVAAGPYGDNIRSSFTVDDLTIYFKARRLHMKNSNSLGFSNALLKKMVTNDLEVKIKRAGVMVLHLSKVHQEMPMDVNTLRIDHPHIQYPMAMAPPDRVLIEKDCKRVTFWHGAQKKVWDLGS
jgi:hypothetical protein